MREVLEMGDVAANDEHSFARLIALDAWHALAHLPVVPLRRQRICILLVNLKADELSQRDKLGVVDLRRSRVQRHEMVGVHDGMRHTSG